MGDSDASSSAAHSAQPKTSSPTSQEGPGLLARVIGAFAPGDTPTPAQPQLVHVNGQSHGLMNLRRMRVEDVAVPKAEIKAVPAACSRDELVDIFKETGLTRIPVFEGTLDQPIGFVHLKDFALQHGFSSDERAFDLTAVLRPLLFVPPSMTIGVLLTKMQTERRHMALVIDEYGGVDGLVTIEDLIEQVVGEIEDEHDTDEAASFVREASGCYLALSKTPLGEFEAELGMSLTDHEDVDAEEIDTLGGLVFMLAGRVPARGEVIHHPLGADFEVIDADPRRIKRLRVRLAGAKAAE